MSACEKTKKDPRVILVSCSGMYIHGQISASKPVIEEVLEAVDRCAMLPSDEKDLSALLASA